MSEIFRKTALDKISSPDQLDQVIVITPPGFWISMLGAGLILLTALIWSIFGRIPVNINANGIYMTGSGIHVVYSEGNGIIEEVLVNDGDKVKEGDVIAKLSDREINDKLKQAGTRREEVEAVTIDSENDVANSDNKSLLDLKSQFLTLNSTLTADEEMLAMRKQQLAELQSKANAAQTRMQNARSKYYGYMTTDSTTPEQIVYQDAQTDLSSAKSYYESAKNQLSAFNAQNNDTLNYLKDKISRLEQEKDSLDKSDPAYQSNYDALQEEIYSLSNERDTIYSQKDAYERSYYEWENKLNNAQNKYYESAFAYLNKESTEIHKNTFDTQLSDDYNLALNEYNTALSNLRSVEDAVSQLTVQTSAEEAGVAANRSSLEAQFDSAKGAVLSNIDNEIKQLTEQLDKTELKAVTSGYVMGINVALGNAVTAGSAVCRIVEESFGQPHVTKDDDGGITIHMSDAVESQANPDYDPMSAILYVPVSKGKNIKAGMEVKVYPTTVNKQEYGHINAFVNRVGDYVTSSEEMYNMLGDDSLVQSFKNEGPVMQIQCSLKRDESTVSGYEWSNRKGAKVELAPGTTVNADIVVEKKAPITMLIPLLKEKLTVKVKTGQDGENR
jgi:multidrug resistance efflux pump